MSKGTDQGAVLKEPPVLKPKSGDAFFDAKFGIEALQHEPYEDGFTWRSVLGAFFIAFVMLPGVIFMGLMIGHDMGTAADWVTIILFVELARRSFITLRKQELYVLKYTVSHLSHISGGVALGGGIFAQLVLHRYFRNSEAFKNFAISHQVPDWYAPAGDAAYQSFTSSVWLPAIGVMVAAALLSKFTQLSLGYIIFKITSDVERLPFPLAPIHAEGAIALAESSQDTNKKGFRNYCFSIGVMIGAAFGLIYIGVPTLTTAFLNSPIYIIPIPFLDLTTSVEHLIPGGTLGLSLNIALLFTGFVLPWRIAVGAFVTTIAFQIIINPLLQMAGYLPTWKPGKDAIETHVATSLDLYLSVGIGTALAVCALGVFGIFKALAKYKKQKAEQGTADDGVDLRRLFHRDIERGDPPLWVPAVIWVAAAVGFIVLANHLVNSGVPENERFSIWWLVAFAFVWTPLNSYINARMSGIAGQHVSIPYVMEGAIFASGYRQVNIWFAPLPLANYGSMADLLRETQLTRTRFTSLLKAELLIFPLMLVASFIFWSYINGLGPIPSDSYAYVQKFWPQHAQMKALWAASMQEGQSMLLKAIKPMVIGTAMAGALGMFGLFSLLGISTQYIYGGLGAMNGYPHTAIMVFLGACLGRYVLSKRFGRDAWTNFAPILAVGFGAGLGLVGMLAIAIHFLWTSIGGGH